MNKEDHIVISHLRKDEQTQKWVLQSNEEHQKGVADRAERFGALFGCGTCCHAMGLIHDIGKEQKAFQRYIRFKSGYDASAYCQEHPNHAYVGGLVINKLFQYPGIYDRIIVSHHSGLKDESDYRQQIGRENPLDEEQWRKLKDYVTLSVPKVTCSKPNDFHHLIRVLFSCLVDADYLDTEQFMNGKDRKELIGKQDDLPTLLQKLETHLQRLSMSEQANAPINKIRREIQSVCRESGCREQGFYSLTVPTGGGKTLAGVLWALRHAVKHHLHRVIIAIPYTSIIVQTAKVLRDIFGENNVLEHHSAFDSENIQLKSGADGDWDRDEFALRQRLASENWDYPIVITTNVQLFESMMASKSSRCRKLHNIVKSVIILDEAQMLPREHLQPIIDTLDTYQRLFSCSVLFTTASQPTLAKDQLKYSALKGLDKVTEIIPDSFQLHDKLRRVELEFDKERHNHEEMAAMMMQHKRVLCIVSTRKDALEIFSRLPKEQGNYHLSRMMCSAHLSNTLEEIRTALKDPSNTVRVVATQLIEAGVDVDFPFVMRQEAGLDSVLQAAGRCNREGKSETLGKTYVFKLEKPLPRGFLTNANDARLSMSTKDLDWFSPEAMKDYFKYLYAGSETRTFDAGNMKQLLYDCGAMQFESADKAFQLIKDTGISVIVNYGDSSSWIEQIKTEPLTYKVRKKLAQYAVNIYEQDFLKLKKAGLVEEVLENIYFVPERAQYDEQVGLSLKNHWLEEILTI